MAVTDWVMVCSSTFRARAVTHSTNRRYPGRVKAQAKWPSSACQVVQTSVACRMGRLLLRCQWGVTNRQVPLGSRPAQGATGGHQEGSFSGKLLFIGIEREPEYFEIARARIAAVGD